MQLLVKLVMNSFYKENIRKDIQENIAGKSEYWMHSEYVERIKVYWKTSHGNYIVKVIVDKRLEDGVKN